MPKSKKTKMKTKLYEVEIDSGDGNPIIVYHVAINVDDFILPVRVQHPHEIISVWEVSDEDSLERSTKKALHIFGNFLDELQDSMPMPVMDNILRHKMGGMPIDHLGMLPIDLIGSDDYQLQIDFEDE